MARSRVRADKLTRILRRLPAEVREGIKKPIADYAEAVLQGARSRVPVRTGNLRSKITKRIARDGLTARVGVLTKKGRKAAFYAHFVEFGTAPHNLAKGRGRKKKGGDDAPKQHPGTPARPFLFPAAEAAKGTFMTDVNSAVSQALEKVAK